MHVIILFVIRKKKELGDTLPTTVAGSLKNNRMRKELSIDIPIVMENDLMCHESIIDVSLAMEPAWWPRVLHLQGPQETSRGK